MIDQKLRNYLFKTFYPDHYDVENDYIKQRLDKAISKIKTLFLESLGEEKQMYALGEKDERIKALEEAIKTGKCKHIEEDVISGECSLCHLAWCEKRIEVLEAKLEVAEEKVLDLEWYNNGQ